MCWIVATRTCQMVGYLTLKKKVVTDSSGEIQFCCKGWLRGVDLNHRPLGYECNHQRNLKTLRGAKSNARSLQIAHRSSIRPWNALTSSLTARKYSGLKVTAGRGSRGVLRSPSVAVV